VAKGCEGRGENDYYHFDQSLAGSIIIYYERAGIYLNLKLSGLIYLFEDDMHDMNYSVCYNSANFSENSKTMCILYSRYSNT